MNASPVRPRSLLGEALSGCRGEQALARPPSATSLRPLADADVGAEIRAIVSSAHITPASCPSPAAVAGVAFLGASPPCRPAAPVPPPPPAAAATVLLSKDLPGLAPLPPLVSRSPTT